MLEIYIGQAFDPKSVVVNPNKTVRQIFEENHIALDPNAVVTHNSSRLGDNELNKSLLELGVEPNDLIVVTAKLNGAC